MGMIATGAYIRTLREAQHLSREKLAVVAGTHKSQIERIEKGEQETRGSLLVAIVHAVQGNLDQVGYLLLSDTATADDGRQLAQTWLAHEERPGSDQFVTHISVPHAQITVIIAHIKQLQAHPEALRYLHGYLERLIEEYLDKPTQPQAHRTVPGPTSHVD